MGADAPCIPGAEPTRHWEMGANHAPGGGLVPGGTGYPCRCGVRGGACLFGRLPPLPLAYLSAPIPPTPFPHGEGGDPKFISPGAPPPAPRALNRLRHLRSLPSRCPEWGFAPCEAGLGVAFRYPAGAWQLRRGSGEQCRQPRRGGTGGEELRRLRWSSPPGQGEQVPAGASQPQTPGAGRASAGGDKPTSNPRGRDSKCRPDIRSPLPQKTNHQTFIDVSCAAHRRAV